MMIMPTCTNTRNRFFHLFHTFLPMAQRYLWEEKEVIFYKEELNKKFYTDLFDRILAFVLAAVKMDRYRKHQSKIKVETLTSSGKRLPLQGNTSSFQTQHFVAVDLKNKYLFKKNVLINKFNLINK